MKTIISLLLALFLALSLSGCNFNISDLPDITLPDGNITVPTEPEETSPAPTEPAPTVPAPTEPAPTVPDSTEPDVTDPSTPPTTGHTYSDFTPAEKDIFTQYVGTLIPFLPNDEYYVEGYFEKADYENGICFYTIGNTEEEYNAYRAIIFSSYSYDGSYVDDEYGDTWYCYSNNAVEIQMTYYEYAGETCVEIYVVKIDDGETPDPGEPDDNTDGKENLITNDGKGLPYDSDGVYDVDFTKADKVKDVTDQGYYLDGCPTVGAPAVLIIPVGFSDGNKLNSTHIDKLEIAFGENGDYTYSVDNFYKVSSYGQLDLNITVLDSWYTPKYASTYYAKLKDSDGYENGDQVLMDEILAQLSKTMDLSLFDSDNNDIIDAVVLINNLNVGDDDFHWAYRYWNTYVDDEGYYYEYDGVSANDYMWASYYFLQERYTETETKYDDTTAKNTYTYIHEFGHILGLDDYYDTSDVGNHPMNGLDVMDYMLGDHNAYSKFNLGWVRSSRLVVTDSSVTLTLEDFSKNGDTIIIANNFDPKLGAYQEYYIVVYYTNNGLNSDDNGYFARDGIVVYHVNASLFKETYAGETYYDVYNNNTDPSYKEYGTEDNLIAFVTSTEGNYTYIAGDYLPVTRDDSGNTLRYTFTVDALTDTTATLTFTAR